MAVSIGMQHIRPAPRRPDDGNRVGDGRAETHPFAVGRRQVSHVWIAGRPVLLKRGLASTIHEWLMSAEYVMSGGNERVMICERGIRTFETYTRNTLDLSAVSVVHGLSHLPVIVDPSHATGHAKLVLPMALGAAAVGADGLMIEVHNDPAHAKCDGAQSLTPDQFDVLTAKVEKVREAVV